MGNSNSMQNLERFYQGVSVYLLVGLFLFLLTNSFTLQGGLNELAKTNIRDLNEVEIELAKLDSRVEALEKARSKQLSFLTMANSLQNSPNDHRSIDLQSFTTSYRISVISWYAALATLVMWALVASGLLGRLIQDITLGLTTVFGPIAMVLYGSILCATGVYHRTNDGFHLFLLLFPLTIVVSRREAVFAGFFRIEKETWRQWIKWASIMLLGGTLYFLINVLIAHKSLTTVSNLSTDYFLLFTFVPFSEEVFFRGFLQRKLQNLMGNQRALLWTSAAYALAHIPKFAFTSQYAQFSLQPTFLSSHPLLNLMLC